MTFSKMVTGVASLTTYLENASKPEDGFRLVLGTQAVKLTVEDAAELAEYIWVHLPEDFTPKSQQEAEVVNA